MSWWERVKCRLGFHRSHPWEPGLHNPLCCVRCEKVTKAPCSNCGFVHDPDAFTICVSSVTRVNPWM